MSNILDRFSKVIQIGVSTKANLFKTTSYGEAGEIQYTSDTHHLFVFPTQEGTPLPVQTLDMMVSNNDQGVYNNNQAVFNF